jgi:hypothetical protein
LSNLYNGDASTTNVCADGALIDDVYEQLEENNFTTKDCLVLCVVANQIHNDTIQIFMQKYNELIA